MSNRACESIMEGEKLRMKVLILELRVGSVSLRVETWNQVMELVETEQRGCEWVCEWDFETVLGSEHGSVRERGDGEQKGEAESTEPRGRGKQRSKNKRVESLEFCLKLGLKRCVSHPFFYNFFLCLTWILAWIGCIGAGTAWISPFQRFWLIRPDSVQIGPSWWWFGAYQEMEKKKRRGTNVRAAASPTARFVKPHWTLVQRLCSRVGAS